MNLASVDRILLSHRCEKHVHSNAFGGALRNKLSATNVPNSTEIIISSFVFYTYTGKYKCQHKRPAIWHAVCHCTRLSAAVAVYLNVACTRLVTDQFRLIPSSYFPTALFHNKNNTFL